jgi:hypothetical protein
LIKRPRLTAVQKERRKPGKPVSAAAGFFYAFGGGQNARFKIRAICPKALLCPETLFPAWLV